MAEVPLIDPERCNGCGLCIEVCSCKALKLVGNVITITKTDECDWCTECEAVCAAGAISCPFEIVCEEG